MLFLRHGHVIRDTDRYMDEADVMLSARGREEAQALGAVLLSFAPNLLVVSTVRRCRETAELAATGLDIPVLHDADLRERAFAPLFGWDFLRIRRVYGEIVEDRLRNRGEELDFAGVETVQSAQTRVVRALNGYADRYSRFAVISHGGPHSWFCCAAAGRPLEELRSYGLATGNGSRFRRDHGNPGGWMIEALDVLASELA